MADLKISQLSSATIPLAGTEVLPIVQSGATKQVSVADLTAGRAISATQLTLTTGNLIVSSGKGIDFSATPGTGTSELLADYEEGTWTPTQGSGLTVVGTFSSSGTYTKVGRIVTLNFRLNATTSLAFTGVAQIATGLPFAVFSDTIGAFGSLINAAANAGATLQVNGSAIFGEVNSMAATTVIYGSVTYMAA